MDSAPAKRLNCLPEDFILNYCGRHWRGHRKDRFHAYREERQLRLLPGYRLHYDARGGGCRAEGGSVGLSLEAGSISFRIRSIAGWVMPAVRRP